MSRTPQLQTLHMARCALMQIPAGVYSLLSLRQLDLSSNSITQVGCLLRLLQEAYDFQGLLCPCPAVCSFHGETQQYHHYASSDACHRPSLADALSVQSQLPV